MAPLDYTAAPFTLAGEPPVIGPPLAGEEQAPGTLPDPSTITLDTVDGNHVVDFPG